MPQIDRADERATAKRVFHTCGLRALARLELGSLKGLARIAPALDAPALGELCLIRSVSMDADDPRRIRDATQIKAFDWFANRE